MNSAQRLKRINELASLAKQRELTGEEKMEQEKLRREYLDEFRDRFRKQIETIEIVEADGTTRSLRKKGSMLH